MPPIEQLIEEFRDKQDLTLKELSTLKTILIGIPDTSEKGLIGKVEQNCQDIKGQQEATAELRRRFWMLVAFLSGSGVLGVGIWQLLK